MKKYLKILFIFLPLITFAQENGLILDSVGIDGILLDVGWKWNSGDNPDFANPVYNDSSWETLNPATEMLDLKNVMESKTGWLKLSFQVDSSMLSKSLSLLVSKQSIASEFYLNNELIGKIGVIGENNIGTKALSPANNTILNLPIKSTGEYLLAVRYAIQKGLPYRYNSTGRPNLLLESKIIDNENINELFKGTLPNFDTFRGGLFFILFILHLSLFSYNSSQKTNFYFLVYALSNCIVGIIIFLYDNNFELVSVKIYSHSILISLFAVSNLSFLFAVYKLFQIKRYFILWGFGVLYLLSYFIAFFVNSPLWSTIFEFLFIGVLFEVIRISVKAYFRKAKGSKIILFGCISYIFFLILFYLTVWGYLPNGYIIGVFWNISNLSLPVSISVYLALEASENAKDLKIKLNQVEELSKEKEQILATQNQELDRQVKERTSELNESLDNLKSTQAQLIQSEKMASLGELTAGIAHEIQNPLNFVNNFSEVSKELAEELKEEAIKENFDKGLIAEIATDIAENQKKIHHHGQRASTIVKGMLEHSRTSSGKKELTDINALADEYLRLSYHGLRAKDKDFNAELVTNFDPNLPKIDVIPQDIGRVLLNLINNAFQAVMEKASMPEGLEGRVDEASSASASKDYKPTVSVSTQLTAKGQKQIAIKIKDNGPGIPDAIKDKIFQPFFTTKDTGKGTGLGLSLAYDIVKAHGGELKVTTEENVGSTFIISLTLEN